MKISPRCIKVLAVSYLYCTKWGFFFFTFDFEVQILKTAKYYREIRWNLSSFPQCLHFPLSAAQYNNQGSNVGIMYVYSSRHFITCVDLCNYTFPFPHSKYTFSISTKVSFMLFVSHIYSLLPTKPNPWQQVMFSISIILSFWKCYIHESYNLSRFFSHST